MVGKKIGVTTLRQNILNIERFCVESKKSLSDTYKIASFLKKGEIICTYVL